MAMRLQDMEKDSLSQSINSDLNESDHNEVHNTYKHRGNVVGRWKNLVRTNSLLLLFFSIVCVAYLFLLASFNHYHNWAVCFIAIFSALCGLSTGFSGGDPSPVRIYTTSVITGISCGVVCLYVIIALSIVVLQSVDEAYADQYDNFAFNEIVITYILGFIMILFSLSTFVTNVRLYIVSEEKRNLALLIHNFKCYTFMKEQK